MIQLNELNVTLIHNTNTTCQTKNVPKLPQKPHENYVFMPKASKTKTLPIDKRANHWFAPIELH